MDAQTLVEETRTRLKKHEGQYAEIARRTPKLSYSSLTKFAHGQADNPTVAFLQKIIQALDAFEGIQSPAGETTAPQAATP